MNKRSIPLGKSGKKFKFRQKNIHRKVNYRWIISVTVITLMIAMVLGYLSMIFMDILSLSGAVFILFFIIFMGIFSDLIGIAVTAANETPFHSMAASKVKGAKESVIIIRNASSVSNFFNDVIGDIAGIISGSASSAIILKLMLQSSRQEFFVGIILGGIIAGVTVGGKAIGKEIALRFSNAIVYRIGLIMYYFKRLTRRRKK